MGTLRRPEQQDESVVFSANPQAIDAAERAATLNIFQATTRVHQQAVTQAVSEAEQITDDQVLRYHAPFLDEATRRLARHLLTQQDTAISHIERIANEYRSRIHV